MVHSEHHSLPSNSLRVSNVTNTILVLYLSLVLLTLLHFQRWNAKSWTVEHQVSSGSDGALSALAVSDNGNYVATGAMFEGIVEVYIAFSLQKIKRVEKSHSTFITGWLNHFC